MECSSQVPKMFPNARGQSELKSTVKLNRRCRINKFVVKLDERVLFYAEIETLNVTRQNPCVNKFETKFCSHEYLTSSLPLIWFGGLTSVQKREFHKKLMTYLNWWAYGGLGKIRSILKFN